MNTNTNTATPIDEALSAKPAERLAHNTFVVHDSSEKQRARFRNNRLAGIIWGGLIGVLIATIVQISYMLLNAETVEFTVSPFFWFMLAIGAVLGALFGFGLGQVIATRYYTRKNKESHDASDQTDIEHLLGSDTPQPA